jgi:hypothetical protein
LGAGLAVLVVGVSHALGPAGWLFPGLVGLLFCAVGVYCLSYPWHVRRRLRQTTYALTDRRALIWKGVGWSGPAAVPFLYETCYEFGPEALRCRSRRRRFGRRIDLVFGEEIHRTGRGGRGRMVVEFGFLGLEDPEQAEELLERRFPCPAADQAVGESMSLVGALPAGFFVARALMAILVIALLSPWFLIGAGLIVVGVRALVDFRHFGELWFCLLPGLLLVGLVAYVTYHHFFRRTGGTIASFEFDGCVFNYRTRPVGTHSVPVGEILSVTERRGVGRWDVAGWSIGLRGGGRVFLCSRTTNAAELMSRLRSRDESVAAKRNVAPEQGGN